MADVGLYTVSGSLMPSISSSWAQLETGSLNLRHMGQQHLYAELITGKALASQVGQTVLPGNPPGATPPSWTGLNSIIPLAHGFVISPLSSSQHEVSQLNTYYSGSQGLEHTPVVASRSLYYEKQDRLVRLVYKLSASAGMNTINPSLLSPALDEYPGRNAFHPISGSYFNSTVFAPAYYQINVPDHGRIRDIKVWMEFIHDHRGGAGSDIGPSVGGSASIILDHLGNVNSVGNGFVTSGSHPNLLPNLRQGLQSVQIALRSPNVNFKFAHPLWNAPALTNFPKWPDLNITAGGFGSQFQYVPDLLQNSYLLWAGHQCEQDLGMSLGGLTSSLPDSAFSSSLGFGPQTLHSAAPANAWGNTVGHINVGLGGVLLTPTRDTSIAVPRDGVPVIAFVSGGFCSYPAFPWVGYPDGAYPFLATPLSQGGPMASYKLNSGPTIVDAGISLTGTMPSLAFGTDDVAQLAYVMFTGSLTGDGPLGDPVLKYARSGTSGGWQTTQLDVLGNPIGVDNRALTVGFPSLAVDRKSSLPRIAYVSGNTIRYASSGTNGWTFSDIYHNLYPNGTTRSPNSWYRGTPQRWLSHDMDLNGLSHLCFVNPQGDVVHLYQLSDGSWVQEFVDSPDNYHEIELNEQPSLKIDVSGNIHFLYGIVQSPTTVSGTFPLKMPPFLGFGFGDPFPNAFGIPVLVHALSSSIGWKYETVDTGSLAFPFWYYGGILDGVFSSGGQSILNSHALAVGTDCVPHVAYVFAYVSGTGLSGVDGGQAFYDLRYAYSSSLGWTVKMADTVNFTSSAIPYSGTFCTDPSIAIDRYGTAHIAYYDTNASNNTGSLKYIAAESSITSCSAYFEYNTDIDMRTIFSDSSRNPNPRHLRHNYLLSTPTDPGPSLSPTLSLLNGKYPSPMSGAITNFGYDFFKSNLDQMSWLTGANFPWMLDDRVPPGNFNMRNYSQFGPPPIGWLAGGQSGVSGTNGVNEWPTSGSQLGPADILPVYPLLDDVYVQKIYPLTPVVNGVFTLPLVDKKIIGFRPGLRGTEINGIWSLLLCSDTNFAAAGMLAGMTPSIRSGIWFRQYRLEFIVDQGHGPAASIISKNRRFANKGNVYVNDNTNDIIQIISGSSEWDIGVNYVYTSRIPEYGRTVGITDSTGSSHDNYSIFTQITGAMADAINSGTVNADVLSSYLNNPYGTPYIPLSSGSGISPSIDFADPANALLAKDILNSVISPRQSIPADNTVRSTLNRLNYAQTARAKTLNKFQHYDKIGPTSKQQEALNTGSLIR